MNELKLKYKMYGSFLFGMLFAVLMGSAMAQPGKNFSELIYPVSDKDVYCSGEKLYFSAFLLQADSIPQYSRVLYAEIISPEGYPHAQAKFELNENGAAGSMQIPESIVTGKYYLRFYTKWMRSNQQSSFVFKPITILNPHVLPIKKTANAPNQVTKGVIDTIFFRNEIKTTGSLRFNPNALVSLNLADYIDVAPLEMVSVSIVKEASLKDHGVYGYKNSAPELTMIPETRGLSLSGKVVNRLDSTPIPWAGVWVSMPLDGNMVLRDVKANSKGEFNIGLGNQYANTTLYIHPQLQDQSKDPLILVDNDYAFSLLSLPEMAFHPDDNEANAYREMMVYHQLKRYYQNDSKTPDDTSKRVWSNFYSQPDFILKIDDYILLPTIEDYIKELMPMVKIRRTAKVKSFELSSDDANADWADPLVMFNYLKISDASSILEFPPRELDRIEVVKGEYVRGDITYGGIIHFLPKTTAQAKIELDESSMELPFNLLSKGESENVELTPKPHQPFVGNGLFWKAMLDLTVPENAEILFNTGSEPGSYLLKIEGVGQDKKVVKFMLELQVY